MVENEYNELSIDRDLVVSEAEEIIEMNNGCLCCMVRGDLIHALRKLLRRRKKFDYILIETSGLTNPGPVAQTFVVDEYLKRKVRLDGIVTVVDAKHVWLHIDEREELREQIAFADVVLLNKTDLATETEAGQAGGSRQGHQRAGEDAPYPRIGGQDGGHPGDWRASTWSESFCPIPTC